MKNFRTMPYYALSYFTFIVLALLILSRYDYTWSNWKPATCMPEACFCEGLRSGIMAQPANTWSSLGFVFVGLMILSARFHGRGESELNAMRVAHTLVYGAAMILIGLGSAFYHASLTFVGQFFDVMGMYLLASFILLYNLSRVTALHERTFVLLYLALNAVLAILLLVLPELRRYLFALLILAALVLAYAAQTRTPRKYLAAAVATLLLSFLFFLLDLTKIFCAPKSWLQGHALWHLGGALSAGLLYQHYRTEKDLPGF